MGDVADLQLDFIAERVDWLVPFNYVGLRYCKVNSEPAVLEWATLFLPLLGDMGSSSCSSLWKRRRNLSWARYAEVCAENWLFCGILYLCSLEIDVIPTVFANDAYRLISIFPILHVIVSGACTVWVTNILLLNKLLWLQLALLWQASVHLRLLLLSEPIQKQGVELRLIKDLITSDRFCELEAGREIIKHGFAVDKLGRNESIPRRLAEHLFDECAYHIWLIV